MGDFDPGRYYYSAHHIARDFIATAAPLTLACLAAYAALPPTRQYVAMFVGRVPASPSWIILIIGVIIFCLFALVCGAVANKAALLMRFVPGLRRPLEFDTFYSKANAAIEAWRGAYLPRHRELWVDDATKREETIDQLVSFFQMYNPIGFLHVYREYSFLFMYRQVAFYAILLFVCAVVLQAWASCLVFLTLFVLAMRAVIASISESVHAEYKFIVSTGAWLDCERQDVEGRGSAGGGLTTR